MLKVRAISDHPVEAMAQAAVHSPYLKQLGELDIDVADPEQAFQQALHLCADVADGALEPKPTLRRAKKIAHLAIAALDLSGQAQLSETTDKITRFADAALEAALQSALRDRELTASGLFVTALGKMGAHELNYSSDIDVAAFFDPDQFQGGNYEPADAAARTIQQMSSLLQDRTRDGYVFRTDLRLRPDPSSTPVAVSTRRAEIYYDSVGQNWERMVWIKGRIAAGDPEAGAAFLEQMQPFVWRRHLDYWAIADVHAIKNMINANAGHASLNDVAADLKLGPGGIREIEFFVQTQQIILGGRHPSLRVRGTHAGLTELVGLGIVAPSAAEELSSAYESLRMVEHRLQMIDDAQTHTLPSFETKRAAIAALCGYSELDAFDRGLIEIRQCVNSHYRDLFADETQQRQRAIDGNLVFTGVDDDPATVQTLSEMCVGAQEQVIDRIRQWHRGRTPATRTTRGRELLTAFLPDLLTAMGRTGEADQAFRQFGRFFEGLRSGVQVLAMLVAEETLTDDLVTTLAIAPRIADTLARRPALLETLVSTAPRKPDPGIPEGADFETKLDLTRRWHGEQAFLIGHQLLHGQIAAKDAANSWSELADFCIRLMAEAAHQETEARFGPAPGVWNVIGMGKLGGGEMTAGSDLDLIVIYDAAGAENAQTWFTKFTQRLIAALSAETAEGSLYETDMRLRPSGRAGPVATSLASFDRYQKEQAWTWEHMALTRLRPVAGDVALGEKVQQIAEQAINTGDPDTRAKDILEMRERLYREKPPEGPWDLKMRQGGLIDLEFITQHAILTTPTVQALKPNLRDAHQQLFETGVWSQELYDRVTETFTFLQALQQVQRMAHEGVVGATELSNALKDRYCRATGCDDFERLSDRLEQVAQTVTDIFNEKVGIPATGL